MPKSFKIQQTASQSTVITDQSGPLAFVNRKSVVGHRERKCSTASGREWHNGRTSTELHM